MLDNTSPLPKQLHLTLQTQGNKDLELTDHTHSSLPSNPACQSHCRAGHVPDYVTR